MKSKILIVLVFVLAFLFFSCQKDITAPLEEIYNSLPSLDYSSQKYKVNEETLSGKIEFNPPSHRTAEKYSLILKYQEKELTVINHTATNSSIIMFAVDTEIGDVCSVYETQGTNNQLVFVNGKLINLEPNYALLDFKIEEDHFIFLLVNPGMKKYMVYKP